MNNGRLLSVFGLVLFVLALFLYPLCAAQESEADLENRRKAEELWEQAIAAKGGRERLHQVESLAVFEHPKGGVLSRRRDSGYPVIFCRFPDKWWYWSDSLTYFVRGRKSILATADQGPDSRFFLIRDQLYYLMETKWLRPVPVSARKEVLDGIRVDVVRVEVQDGKDGEFFLDPKTHLPMEVRIGKREEKRLPPWTGLSLSNYAPCQGIQMARNVKAFKLNRHPVGYEINPEYDETFFDRPTRFEDGPEAWRPKGGPERPIVRCK